MSASRSTQAGELIIQLDGPSASRDTQVSLTAIGAESPLSRDTQVGLLVIYPFDSPPLGGAKARAYLIGA